MKKCRADELLCLRGHCAEKEEAAILIMAGKVRTSPDNVVQKPSEMLSVGSESEINERAITITGKSYGTHGDESNYD